VVAAAADLVVGGGDWSARRRVCRGARRPVRTWPPADALPPGVLHGGRRPCCGLV
jgi:hypothetical protein